MRQRSEDVEIQKTAIVGMGALGMMYGAHIQRAAGKSAVVFVMDSARFQRHQNDTYTVNGVRQDFAIRDCTAEAPADLVIVATKYNGLAAALDVMENIIGENTVILSVMNGITSEGIIAARFGDQNLVHCVALGMDAMREGTHLTYTKKGKLQIGIVDEKQKPALLRVARFFDRIEMPYSIEEDILHAMWGKFLLNVGINQTCMVYETTYQGALETPAYFEAMTAAMREVIAIAHKEGVRLTEEDVKRYLKVLRTLQPDGYPSMRQDALAQRKSEVELFAGTVLKIAEKHGVPAPTNAFFARKIREMEAAY